MQAPLPFTLINAECAGLISKNHALGIIVVDEDSSTDTLEKATRAYHKHHTTPSYCFTHRLPATTPSTLDHDAAASIYRQLGLNIDNDTKAVYTFNELLSYVIAQQPKLIGFAQGIPNQHTIDHIHKKNIRCFAICRSISEALAAYAMKIDIIVLQGIEAGGIHGRFANTLNEPMQPCFSLLAQLRHLIDIPIILWGDFPQGNDIVAALIAGAEGVMIDRPWLACEDVPLTAEQRQHILHTNETQSTLSTTFSPLPMRHLNNPLNKTLNSDYPQRTSVLNRIFQTHPDWKPLCVSPTPVPAQASIAALCQHYAQSINQYLA